MKIVFEKSKDDQQFAISAKEIKLLFGLIPELSKWIKIVLVQNQDMHKTGFPRPVRFEMLSSKLNILAKGLSKDEIVKEVLIELISERGNDITLRPASLRSLSKVQMRKINSLAEPILLAFNKKLIES